MSEDIAVAPNQNSPILQVKNSRDQSTAPDENPDMLSNESSENRRNSYGSTDSPPNTTSDSSDSEHVRKSYFEERVAIPDTPDSTSFSFRKLWAFSGPGFLMSIAYLDPGNIESDLQAGSVSEYRLLWVVMWATLLGLMMQRLSARLGTVTGLHLAEVCYRQYPAVPRLALWICTEIAIIGSDMQEVIGTAIAIYLLSNKVIPLWGGVLITIVDTFTFLGLDKFGLRKLEAFFALLIATMALSFGYEYGTAQPDQWEVVKGLAIPDIENNKSLLQAVGIIGAIIMPHNLYLHSALVKSRAVDKTNKAAVKEANMYVFIEATVALLVSLVINIFVVAVFAQGLYNKTNLDVREMCFNASSSMATHADVFPNNTDLIDADLYKGGVFLGCRFGEAAMYIWAIGILAAGQSSTMTGTYAGQFAMEGFLNLTWKKWQRVLLTRTIAIIPTFSIAFYSKIDDLSGMNDLLNCLMSLMLPFAVIPTITFTSNKRIMGSFTNGLVSKIFSVSLSTFVIAVNIYFVINYVIGLGISNWAFITMVVFLGVVYIVFCFYLTVDMSVAMGSSRLARLPAMQRIFSVTNENYNIHEDEDSEMDESVEERGEGTQDR